MFVYSRTWEFVSSEFVYQNGLNYRNGLLYVVLSNLFQCIAYAWNGLLKPQRVLSMRTMHFSTAVLN